MLFGCYDIAYKGLTGVCCCLMLSALFLCFSFDNMGCGCTAQMLSIKLSKFQNFWSDVYDFTPDSKNWDYVAQVTIVITAATCDALQDIALVT